MSQTNTKETKQYRTIPKAVKEIRENDPNSAITEYGIRLAIKKEQIRFKNIGKRIVVDLEEVQNYYGGMNVVPAKKKDSLARKKD